MNIHRKQSFLQLKYKMEMNTKNLMVSFVAIAMTLFLVANVSAAGEYNISRVEVNNINIVSASNPAPIDAGETTKVEVWFSADFNATEDGEDFYDSDVTVEVEIDTGKKKVNAVSESMVIESGDSKKVTLNLKVPYELKDDLSKLADLSVEISGEKFELNEDYNGMIRVRRAQYEVDFKSISAPQTVEAGETFPVDIVVKNIGYNDLDDLYVKVSIPELDIEKTSYFGDLVAMEEDSNDDDETDTFSGRLYLKVPYDVSDGIYALEVEVTNDDTTSSEAKQIVIENDFSENVIVTSTRKTVAIGEDAEYELLIVNPTDKLKVYRIVTESSGSLSSDADKAVVVIPAGSSKTVTITANTNSEGEYNFNVNVFSGEELVSTVSLSLNAEGRAITSPIVVLTVVLAIIFLVLLVVLIVLVTKKPEKAEEFGESYY